MIKKQARIRTVAQEDVMLRKCGLMPKIKELTPAEAIYAFCGWLTTRKIATQMSSSNNCSPVVERIKEFCEVQGFVPPREDYANGIKEMPPLREGASVETNDDAKTKIKIDGLALSEHNRYAEVIIKMSKNIDELKELVMWMTGCGYDFCQHEYFCEKRDDLLKTGDE